MGRGRGKATPQDIEVMKHVSITIQRLLSENNLKQAHLADLLEIPRSSFNEYVKGTTIPKPGNVQKIADYFGLKKSDIDPRFKPNQKPLIPPSFNMDPGKIILVSNYDKLPKPKQDKLVAISEAMLSDKVTSISDKQATYDTRKRITLSVPGKVSAGTGYWQEDDYDTMVDFYADEIPDEKDYDTIAIVVGHSMEPKIKNGDFLFIKLQNQIDLNKIGIFQVSGENFVKKLKEDRLESLNKDYDDVDLSEDIRTIGKVVDVYREG